MLKKTLIIGIVLFLSLILLAPAYAQKTKIGYVNTQKILTEYKEALDAQKKIDELNSQWEKEGLEMQKEWEKQRDLFDSQSLLLSESKKAEKAKEIQQLYSKIQQFQRDKWAPGQGEIYKKEKEFMNPVYEKIFAVVTKIGEDEDFSYIFDSTDGNILYANDKQPDLTERVLEELNKSLAVEKKDKKDN